MAARRPKKKRSEPSMLMIARPDKLIHPNARLTITLVLNSGRRVQRTFNSRKPTSVPILLANAFGAGGEIIEYNPITCPVDDDVLNAEVIE